jgi:GT2 family glycosyltransferase
MPKILQIIIPTFNRAKITDDILSVLGQQKFLDFEIMVVDSGSTDDTHDIVRKHGVDLMILNPDAWWTAAVMKGVERVLLKDPKAILILNDDVFFDEYFIESMMDSLNEFKDSIIVPSQLDQRGNIFNGFKLNGYFREWKPVDLDLKENHTEIDIGNGCAVLIPSKILKNISLFNELLCPHYGGDVYMFLRARKSKIKIHVASSIKIFQTSTTDPNSKMNRSNVLVYKGSIFHLKTHWAIGNLIYPKIIEKMLFGAKYYASFWWRLIRALRRTY